MKVGDRVVIKGGAGSSGTYPELIGREVVLVEIHRKWFQTGHDGYVVELKDIGRRVYLKENIAPVKEQQVLEILREYESRRQGNSNRG